MISLGIDIGSFSIKVAKVRSSSRGYELISFSEYPLGQDPNKDNSLEIIEALRDIMSRYREEGCHIVVGAHQSQVSIRRKEFPFRERHKILKSLPFELEDDMPFSPENAVYDARTSFFVGNSAHVLAAACPHDHIEKIVQRLLDAGVGSDIVSVDGVAFASMFEEWREAPWEYPINMQSLPAASPADVIIDIGHKTTTIAVIKDGYTLDVRSVDWGGKDVADSIASRYSMHYIEALKELRKKAFILTQNEGATKDQILLSDIIKTSVDGLAQKLRFTLLELKNLHNLEYRQAIMTGGVSQLRNLGPYLTQKLELACNRLGKLDSTPQLDYGSSPNNELALVTAIGLAVEGIRRPKNPALNLLRGEFAKQSQSLRVFWEKWSHAAQMIALCFVIVFVWGLVRESFTSSNVDVAQENLGQLGKNIVGGGGRISPRGIRKYIKEQEQKMELKNLVEDLQNINSALDVLKKISDIAPVKRTKGVAGQETSGLNVRDFSVNSEKLVISGEARTVEILTQLQAALKSIAAGGKVTTKPPEPATTPNYKSFSYEVVVNRRSGG